MKAETLHHPADDFADGLFRAVLEAAPDAMIIIDRAGVIRVVNTQAERMFGYGRDELLGNPVEILVPERFRDAHVGHREEFMITPHTRGMGSGQCFSALRRDGSEFPAEIGISPLTAPGGPWVIAAIRDVTERARAENEIRRLNAELEEGVSRRTAALSKANDELRREITARHRLEREILEISEREQQRIGRDLHDDLGQRLVGISYLSQALSNQLDANGSPEAGHAAKITGLLKDALALTRSLARGLHPVALKSGGLVASLHDLAERTAEIFRIECRFDGPENEPLLAQSVATHFYRIAQEAVTNSVNHGKASHITITLDAGGLTVRDNGSGMPRPNPRHKGMGLRIMRYRADVIGATLTFENPPSGGTLINCRIPASP
jgi:PAS domain S-box-containing protein